VNRDHRRGLLAVLFAAVLWSTGGLLIKWVSVDGLVTTMWRSVFAAGTIAFALKGARSVRRTPWGLLIGLALSYAALLVMFVTATRLTTAANAIFLQYTAPLHVVLFGLVFWRHRPSGIDLITLAAAFGGMALFFVGKLSPANSLGNYLALGSGVAFGAFLLLLKHRDADDGVRLRAMVLGNVLLAVGLAVFHAASGRSEAFSPPRQDLLALAFLGVVQIGLAYIIFAYGIARIAALEASLLGMLEPVLNPVWVWLVLGESPGGWAVLGGAIILGALVLRTVVTERGMRAPKTARA